MNPISGKVLLAILAIAIALTATVICAIADIGGFGTWLGGFSGPFTRGLTNVGAIPLNFGLASGWNMLLLYIAGLVILPVSVAAIVWHYDIPYKWQNVASPSNASTYDTTLKREPDEPEPGPSSIKP